MLYILIYHVYSILRVYYTLFLSLEREINFTLVSLSLSFSLLSILIRSLSILRVFHPVSIPRARGHTRAHTHTPAHPFAKFSKRHGVSHGHKSSFLALSSHLVRCQHAFARFTAISSAASVSSVLASPQKREKNISDRHWPPFDL